MLDRRTLYDVVFSTEYHKQPGSFGQLSIYNATLPIGFAGYSLFWSWAFLLFVLPRPFGEGLYIQGLSVFLQLLGIVLTCVTVYLVRSKMRLRYLYRLAFCSTLAEVLVLILIRFVGLSGFQFFIVLCEAFVAGVALASLLMLWMQHFGKFWRYRISYGIAISILIGMLSFIFIYDLDSLYTDVLRVLLPASSLACWRYMSYISKGIQSPYASSALFQTSLQPRISPISFGLGVGFGFLLLYSVPHLSTESIPLLCVGFAVGPICYAFCARSLASYMRMGNAYKVAALLLVAIALTLLLFPSQYYICAVLSLMAFSWTCISLIISLTAAVIRNPRKQLYYTCCRGFLWLPLGMCVGALISTILGDASFFVWGGVAVSFSMIIMLYAVVLEGLVLLLAQVDGNGASDYEEVSEARGFSQRCAQVADKYSLTSREAEVLSLVARGKTMNKVAELLNLSPYTVHTHVNHIYRKIGINSKGELLDIIDMDTRSSVAPTNQKSSQDAT